MPITHDLEMVICDRTQAYNFCNVALFGHNESHTDQELGKMEYGKGNARHTATPLIANMNSHVQMKYQLAKCSKELNRVRNEQIFLGGKMILTLRSAKGKIMLMPTTTNCEQIPSDFKQDTTLANMGAT